MWPVSASGTVLALWFLNSVTATASSVHPRKQGSTPTCQPHFEGAGVSVTKGAFEWGAQASTDGAYIIGQSPLSPMLAFPDFRFQRTKTPDPHYYIKNIWNHRLAVSVEDAKSLVLKAASTSDQWQLWNVNCDFCATNISAFSGQVAFGCHVTSGVNKECVQTDSDKTKPLFLAKCTGIDDQRFAFWTSTSPTSP